MVGMWNLSAVKLRRGPNVEPSLGAGGRLYCDWILDANGGSKEFTWEKGWRKKKPRSVHGMGWSFSEVYSGLAQLYIQRPYLAQAWMGHECQAQAHPFIQSARAKLGFFMSCIMYGLSCDCFGHYVNFPHLRALVFLTLAAIPAQLLNGTKL